MTHIFDIEKRQPMPEDNGLLVPAGDDTKLVSAGFVRKKLDAGHLIELAKVQI